VQAFSTTRSWPDLVAFYRDFPVLGPPMVALAQHVDRSPYASKIHGLTMHEKLLVAQTADVYADQELVLVAPFFDHVLLTVLERGVHTPQRALLVDARRDDPLARRVPPSEIVDAFERILSAKRWI